MSFSHQVTNCLYSGLDFFHINASLSPCRGQILLWNDLDGIPQNFTDDVKIEDSTQCGPIKKIKYLNDFFHN